ncbi:hypothetical protein [Saliphagus sp. LR7]|uniref:hypothetical protein n=1 Tax=Saliphagus sp. LR7 TaxID=2282654 RepID=UPI000DF80653|nr:hypothetical protein [Saliphagus sp. LR7]
MSTKSNSVKTTTYQGKIDQAVWDDFKQFVPRTTNLDEKVNELIREWTREQKHRKQRLAELENGDT